MRKRFTCFLVSLTVCLCTSMTAYAENDMEQENPSSVNVFNSIGFVDPSSDDSATGDAGDYNGPLNRIGAYPYEIKFDTFNNMPVIIKSYKVPDSFDPEQLVERDFEENGYIYSRRDIIKSESIPNVDEKQASQSVLISTQDNAMETVIASLGQYLDYSEDGYTGQLELDITSIRSVVAGTQTYSYPIRKVVEYNNLDSNDYANLNKTNGNLILQDVNWTAQGGTQRGDIVVPSAFTAEAVYTGVGYGSKVTGYNNTAVYKGTVTKAAEGDTLYSIVYQGVIIEPETDFSWLGLIVGVGILAIIGFAAYFVITRVLPNISLRKKKSPSPVVIPD